MKIAICSACSFDFNFLCDIYSSPLSGIPTLVIAAASIDDVLAITGFSVALGIAFDSGANLAFTIIRGPLEVVIGVGYGFFVGVLAWLVHLILLESLCQRLWLTPRSL